MNLTQICAACRQCEGAAYQSPPALFAGNVNAPIMVMGQNPGEIHGDKFRLDMAAEMLKLENIENAGTFIEAWYHADYGSSGNASMVAEVLGEGWLENGTYLYTNAVRCRTEGNHVPTKEMVDTCNTWTRKLFFSHKREGVILLGAIATEQLLGKSIEKLPVGVVRRHPRFGVLLRLSHPSTWKAKDIKANQVSFEEFKVAIGDTYAAKS